MILSLSLCACGNNNKDNDENIQSAEIATDVTRSPIVADNPKETQIPKKNTQKEVNTNITDFSVSIEKAKLTDANGNNPIEIDKSKNCYKINFNHKEDVYEVNFYKIPSSFIVKDGNFDMQSREYVATYPHNISTGNAYFKYDVQKDSALILSFLTKGNQVFEYYIEPGNEKNNALLKEIGSLDYNNLTQYETEDEN